MQVMVCPKKRNYNVAYTYTYTLDSEPLTKWDAHPSIVSIKRGRKRPPQYYCDGSTTTSRFPPVLMTLCDSGSLYTGENILCAWILELVQGCFKTCALETRQT